MSHCKRELSFKHLNNLRMFVHLQPVAFSLLRILLCKGPKIDFPLNVDGPVVLRVRVDISIRGAPKIVLCSIFNEILPIGDFDRLMNVLNNGHWLIRPQVRAISAKDWDVAFFQWSFAWFVRKKFGVGKFWVSLHSRNASFNGGGAMWRRNRISPDTTKGRLLWINGYFRWYFMTVVVEQIVYFPQQSRC